MKRMLHIYYDEEGDFFDIQVGNPKKGKFKNLGKGVFERIDEKTGDVTGITIHGFRKKTSKLRDFKITLPVMIELTS